MLTIVAGWPNVRGIVHMDVRLVRQNMAHLLWLSRRLHRYHRYISINKPPNVDWGPISALLFRYLGHFLGATVSGRNHTSRLSRHYRGTVQHVLLCGKPNHDHSLQDYHSDGTFRDRDLCLPHQLCTPVISTLVAAGTWIGEFLFGCRWFVQGSLSFSSNSSPSLRVGKSELMSRVKTIQLY